MLLLLGTDFDFRFRGTSCVVGASDCFALLGLVSSFSCLFAVLGCVCVVSWVGWTLGGLGLCFDCCLLT